MKNIVQITVDFAESRGGASKTVTAFQHATKSHVVSINDPALELWPSQNVTAVPASQSQLGARYAFCSKSDREALENRLQEANLIICHQFFRFHVQLAYRVARAFGIPYWIVPHGTLDPYVFTYRRLRKSLWMSILGKRMLRDAEAVIFASESEKEKAKSLFDIPRALIIHWPVSVHPTVTGREAKSEFRRRFGIPEEDRIVLYVGRLHSSKRPYETIQAVAAAQEPSLHLVIVGPPDDISTTELISFAANSGFKNLHIAGAL